MSHRRRPLLVMGGYLDPTTGRLARELAAGVPEGPDVDLLIWDEHDVEDQWHGRPRTFVVRDRSLPRWLRERNRPSLASAADTIELRVHLARRRRAPLVLLGHVSLGAAPWLQRHRARRTWLPTPDDRRLLDDGLVAPPADAGGPHQIVNTWATLRDCRPLVDDRRYRWEPGFLAAPPPVRSPPVIFGLGLPDRTNGIDLAGRILAARADAFRGLGASVTWLAPPGAEIPRHELDDLRRSQVDDLIETVEAEDPSQTLEDRCAAGDALLIPIRPGGSPDEQAMVVAHRNGLATVGFGYGPHSHLAIDKNRHDPAFGDVVAAADALLGDLGQQATTGCPGPVGLHQLSDSSTCP